MEQKPKGQKKVGMFSKEKDKGYPQDYNPARAPINFKYLLSGKTYISLIFIGLIVIFIGVIILIISNNLHYYYFESDLSDRYFSSKDAVRVISVTGSIIEMIGFLFLLFGMIYGALLDESLHTHIRVALLIAIGIIIGLGIF